MVVLTAALVLPLTVPYAVAVRLRRGEFRRKRACADSPAHVGSLRRLDESIRGTDPAQVLARLAPPPIEWLARDLRRLDRQRRGGVTLESVRWRAAVMRAYDERLCLACQCLGVTENLRPLDGLDREVERVRVEGALEEAGLQLR
jgi:hypothetical protein